LNTYLIPKSWGSYWVQNLLSHLRRLTFSPCGRFAPRTRYFTCSPN